MCSFHHKWASERQLYLFVLLHHVIMKWNSVVYNGSSISVLILSFTFFQVCSIENRGYIYIYIIYIWYVQILYSALKNMSESLTDGNCITGLFKYINPVSPPHKKMKVAIILQIHLVVVCMAERRNKVTRIFASTGSIYIISTHWRSGLLLCCFHQLLEHSVKFTPLK